MLDPRGMSLREFADGFILTSGDQWGLPRLSDESEWQEWAATLVRAQPYAQRTVPDPYQFDDWREWAMRSYPMLEDQN